MQSVKMRSCWIQVALNPTHVLIRRGELDPDGMACEGGGRGWSSATTGHTKDGWPPAAAGGGRKEHPLSLWREHSPAHTLTPYDGLCNCERIQGCFFKPQFVAICYRPWKK